MMIRNSQKKFSSVSELYCNESQSGSFDGKYYYVLWKLKTEALSSYFEVVDVQKGMYSDIFIFSVFTTCRCIVSVLQYMIIFVFL